MTKSMFFETLRIDYNAEIDDNTLDSDNKNVFMKNLREKRKPSGRSLLQAKLMSEAPTLGALLFFDWLEFRRNTPFDNLISKEEDELPTWEELLPHLEVLPCAQEHVDYAIAQVGGNRFMVIVAGLEYSRRKSQRAAKVGSDEDEQEAEARNDSDGDDGDEGEGGNHEMDDWEDGLDFNRH